MPQPQAYWIKLLRHHGWRQQAGGRHQVKMTMQGRRPVTLPHNHGRAYSKGFEAQLRRETRLNGGEPPGVQRSRRRQDPTRDR